MIRICGLKYEKNKMLPPNNYSNIIHRLGWTCQKKKKKRVGLVHTPRGIIMAVNKLIK